MNDSQIAYRRILAVFNARLEMKHQLKGTSFRKMYYYELEKILADELLEFKKEMSKGESDFRATKAIEEAVDVMISAMMIADKILGGIEE